jgi:hypothetical protein
VSEKTIVLKFGSSVSRGPSDLHVASTKSIGVGAQGFACLPSCPHSKASPIVSSLRLSMRSVPTVRKRRRRTLRPGNSRRPPSFSDRYISTGYLVNPSDISLRCQAHRASSSAVAMKSDWLSWHIHIVVTYAAKARGYGRCVA